MAGLWRSARLVYRALEKDDEPLIRELKSDPEAFVGVSPVLPSPQSKKNAEDFYDFLLKRCMLTCVICLPAPEASGASNEISNHDTSKPKPIPIGMINLAGPEPDQFQHRRGEIGINVLKHYQGKGYGTEAINWALSWAFRYAGMHRVDINAYASNSGAVKLYEKMGFVLEGRRREAHFLGGTFYDEVNFGMLESDWRQREENASRGG